MYVKLIEPTPTRSTPFGLGKYGVFHSDGVPVVDPDESGRYAQVVFELEEDALLYLDRGTPRYALRVYRNGVYAWTNWYVTSEKREAWLTAREELERTGGRTTLDYERVDPYDSLPD